MRAFLFNLTLISCSLFVFSVTVDAHPHKSSLINHGPSLESYQIELDFSSNHLIHGGATSNIKIADKKKTNKVKSETKKIKTYKKISKNKNKKNKESK